MLRWCLWVALLFAIPIGGTLGTWLLLAPDQFRPEAMMTALGVGLLAAGSTMVGLKNRIRDDRGTRLAGGIVVSSAVMWQTIAFVAVLTWVSAFGWCGSCIGRGFFEMVIDDDLAWPRYDPPYPPRSHPSIPIVESIILIVSLAPGLLAALGAAAASQHLYTRWVRLSRGECGRCGYPLHGLKEEEDGCRICPECGAAWRKRVELDDF